MAQEFQTSLFKRAVLAALMLCAIVLIGSFGYWALSDSRQSLLDCLYMSVITVTTVGFGEIIELDSGGRILTIAIALSGIGTMTYLLSSITAFVVEGELTETFRRRSMEKKAKNLQDHFIVCGAGKVGFHIVQELRATHRPCVVMDPDPTRLEELAATFKDIVYLDADATDNDALTAAGVKSARGIFAATDDDNQNLVVSLTAKQLNPGITVVARCRELKNIDKMKAAGADGVISPSFIGGMRMASEMIRPTVVSFLDTMLRDRDTNLRIEEVAPGMPGSRIRDLGLADFHDTLLLAIRTPAAWTYNPPPDHVLEEDSGLIVMTTPAERASLERHFKLRRAHGASPDRGNR